MRTLFYVPIIHEESDLGSLGPALDMASASLFGEKRWTRHKETVAAFWKAVAAYLDSVDPRDFRIYQDGLAADGDLGRRIVDEAAKRGSKNHRIVLDLMGRGAQIHRTEDLSLLLEERQQVARGSQGESSGPGAENGAEYNRQVELLTRQRDSYIAKQINDTLKEGETGILFIGAYHDVPSYLNNDIQVIPIKDKEKVRAYFRELISSLGGRRLGHLATYLASPVRVPGDKAKGPKLR